MRRDVVVEYSKKFLRALKKISPDIQDKAESQEYLFKLNPFDQRLHTHKLRGKDKHLWAYSVDHRYRIKFIFLDDDHRVLYLDIGMHDDVY